MQAKGFKRYVFGEHEGNVVRSPEGQESRGCVQRDGVTEGQSLLIQSIDTVHRPVHVYFSFQIELLPVPSVTFYRSADWPLAACFAA